MLDIVENITLESVNETSELFLNFDQLVDSRLEMEIDESASHRWFWNNRSCHCKTTAI